MEDRKPVTLGEGLGKIIPIFKDENMDGKYSAQVISPILAEGDVIGAVIIASKEQGKKFTDTELKLSETAASFLGKQMEA